MGTRWPVSGRVPLCSAVRVVALATVETQSWHAGATGFLAHLDAHGRYLLAYRTGIASHISLELGAFRRHCRDGRLVDGVLLPQPEIASTASGQRAANAATSGAVAW